MRISHALLALLISAQLTAQLYPDSNATWCLTDPNTPSEYDVNMVMDADPDTTIMGQIYKRVREYRGIYGETSFELRDRHYVRSAEDGKGYVFLLDSMAEYLTGDTAAQAGDTLQNVLVWNDMSDCYPFDFVLFDVIVDSVVTISNAGVTVRRHFAHTPCYLVTPGQFQPYRFFWQAGMGTSAGPYMHIRSGFVPITMICMMSGSSTRYSIWGAGPGQPGGDQCCWPITISNAVVERSPRSSITATPNPSTGLFSFNATGPIALEVFNSLGQPLMNVNGRSIDLSARPEGIYVVHLASGKERAVLRLIVQK